MLFLCCVKGTPKAAPAAEEAAEAEEPAPTPHCQRCSIRPSPASVRTSEGAQRPFSLNPSYARCSDVRSIDEPAVNTLFRAEELPFQLQRQHTKCEVCKPEELIADVLNLHFLGRGSFACVYKGIWQAATVAVKFILSKSMDRTSASYREALLCKGMSHPNTVQTYVVRCAQLDPAFFSSVTAPPAEAPPGPPGLRDSEYQSGDGFGDPLADVADGGGKCATWGDILGLMQAAPGQHITLVIMEFCDKGNLANAIPQGVFGQTSNWSARLGLRALLRTAREIAQGLCHMHNANIIHGDLKPANVLLKGARLDRRGFVAKLSDFGLSHVLRSHESNSSVEAESWGTLAYMAPEHFLGSMSKACDIYSFGMVLWEMASGMKPYKGMKQGAVMHGVSSGLLRPVWPLSAPSRLARLGQSCLAQAPEARPSLEQILKELALIEAQVRLEGRHQSRQSRDSLTSNNNSSSLSSVSPVASSTNNAVAAATQAQGSYQAQTQGMSGLRGQQQQLRRAATATGELLQPQNGMVAEAAAALAGLQPPVAAADASALAGAVAELPSALFDARTSAPAAPTHHDLAKHASSAHMCAPAVSARRGSAVGSRGLQPRTEAMAMAAAPPASPLAAVASPPAAVAVAAAAEALRSPTHRAAVPQHQLPAAPQPPLAAAGELVASPARRAAAAAVLAAAAAGKVGTAPTAPLSWEAVALSKMHDPHSEP